MPAREIKLRNLLRLEVANKGTQSSLAFIVFSIFIFIYHFNCTRFELAIQLSMAGVFCVSVLRLLMAKKIRMQGKVHDKEWRAMVIAIWLNSFFWGLTYALASIELKLEGIHFIVVTTMLAGFIAASLVTLGYDPILFIPFQFLHLLPQVGIILYFYFSPEQHNALPLIPPYILYFIYQMKQFKDFNGQMRERFNYQLDLEASNAELKKSQDALIDQTIKLVHSSRLAAVGEMSAGIAHEVNNPLAIISGSTQQIERLISKDDKNYEKILPLTQKALLAIERVTKIIRGLRHFSQQSDSLPKSKVILSEIVEDTVNFCNEMLSTRYIKLHIAPCPDIQVECNPVQISQVLINLIKNAEDALDQEKDEKERWIELSFVTNIDFIILQVVNGGPKIPKEIHDKLFQPFFTTKPVGKGTGLGLSISQGIMREHGGDLIFDQTAEKTTFAIQIPMDSSIMSHN